MISFLMDDRDISFRNFANILIVAGKKEFFFSILFHIRVIRIFIRKLISPKVKRTGTRLTLPV